MTAGKPDRRRRTACLAGLFFAVVAWPLAATAQQVPIVYPAGGQSFETQSADEAQCRQWAQQQTGVNPNQVPPGYYGNPYEGAPVVRGAARGAAVGAVGGAIGGDAGKGAAIGAGVGATVGVIRRQDQQRQTAAAQQQYQAQMATYYRGFGTCMQGRGYTVN
jgi:hypothetical protein